MRLDLGPDLPAIKAKALKDIDRAAEVARLRYVTPGSGQSMEYVATESEARLWRAQELAGQAPALEGFPFLKAEYDALAGLPGAATPDVSAMVAEILAQADGWVAIGSEIKRIRRWAKLAVEQAISVTEVQVIMSALEWP